MSVFSNIPTITSFGKKKRGAPKKPQLDKLLPEPKRNAFTDKPDLEEFRKELKQSEDGRVNASNRAKDGLGSWPGGDIFTNK